MPLTAVSNPTEVQASPPSVAARETHGWVGIAVDGVWETFVSSHRARQIAVHILEAADDADSAVAA